MVLDPLDSSGPSPLIVGRELEELRLFSTRFEWSDALHLIGNVQGSRFTRCRTQSLRVDQSRLDRFYFSDGGWWPHRILDLQHIQDQTLSDHDQVCITFIIENRISLLSFLVKKSSYFKANSYILESEDNIKALKEAWLESGSALTNPQVSFRLACSRLRSKYKLLQAEPRHSNKNKDILKARLWTLKADLEDEESPDIVSDWTETFNSLRDLELKEANRWRVILREKWVTDGNKSSPFSFQLSKAKQQCEQMNML